MLAALNSIAAAGASIAAGAATPAPAAGQATAPAPFADLLTDAVGEVSQLESQAEAAVHGLMTGTGVDVHQAMIAGEKASMAFELALAVRNKAVAAYQQVIGMQF
ncbi:MAG: flagellar hook-basal body complex protein FliE [Terracidiphilus sp.]